MHFLCTKHEHHICHSKKMFHLFENLEYYTFTNIIHSNHNTKFMKFLFKLIKHQILHKICTNL